MNSKCLTTCLVWVSGVKSGVKEDVTILKLGIRVGGRKMAPTRQLHICNKVGERQVRRKSSFFELITDVLDFHGLKPLWIRDLGHCIPQNAKNPKIL